MKIIGFIGHKGTGKTTACRIVESHIKKVVQHNFKDGLVSELKEIFPKVLEEIAEMYYHNDDKEGRIDRLFFNKPPVMRALMQNFGIEFRRADDPDYWVNLWKKSLVLDEGLVLVDDVRFKNEAEAVKSSGGILIRLVRGDIVNTDKHSSEVELKMIKEDHRIVTCVGELSKLELELCRILA